MMWHSLLKLRALPDDTRFYCGHEYTSANIRFAKTIEPNNKALAARADEVAKLVAAGKPTIPATIGAEKAANPFLRADDAEVAKSPLGSPAVRPGKCSRKSANVRTGFDRSPRRAADVIRLLDLKPHPEGGHFRETFRDMRQVDGPPRRVDCDLFSAGARRALALAPHRRGRSLALVCRRAACAGNCPRAGTPRAPYARLRSCRGRTPAGHCPGSCLAGGAKPRRLDALRLYRCAGL